MDVEITSRTVVDGVWREVGQVYDLPAHRCKELFDSGRAKPARGKPAEAAVETEPEDAMERPRRRRGK